MAVGLLYYSHTHAATEYKIFNTLLEVALSESPQNKAGIYQKCLPVSLLPGRRIHKQPHPLLKIKLGQSGNVHSAVVMLLLATLCYLTI